MGLFLKGVTETVQNEVKQQKGRFLSILLDTLGVSLLENLLTGKGIYRAGKGRLMNRTVDGALGTRQGRGILRAVYGSHSSKMDF